MSEVDDTGRASPEAQFGFLFTDIESSSVKWLRHGERMRLALEQHDSILRNSIEANGGTVFKTAGDAFFAAFPVTAGALHAALDAQRAMRAADWSDVEGCAVRMAIHCGGASVRDGDYFGAPLNRCARLLNLGHGGQVLLTATMAAELEPLSGDIDFPQIGMNPLDDPDVDEPIHQLLVSDLRQDFPPLRDPRALASNLPGTLDSIVGRDVEIEEIQEALTSSRWVTLTGIGGIGKTRLALEVAAILSNAGRGGETARKIRARLRDGIWLAELAPIARGDLIASSVASAMGIELPGTRAPLAELIDRLRSRSVLLLLDNCEHLLDSVAQFGFVLMAQCPRVIVLASSQDLTGLPAEVAIPVGGLALPPIDVATAEEALRLPAVQLFVARAHSADPKFQLLDRDAPAAAAICHHLDGIALAIEMAAARAPMFGVGPLAARIADRFRELVRPDDAGPSRHQTLQAAIDWSFGLLGQRERLVLRRVSVFSGGFSMDDAVAVVGSDDLNEIDILNALAELVRRSLLARDQQGNAPRYRMLQTVLAYAHERLDEADESAIYEHRQVQRMVSLMDGSFESALALPDAQLRETYQPDLPNVRVALERALAERGDPSSAVRIAGAAQPLFAAMGLLPEARESLDTALGHVADADPASVARAWLGLGLAIGFSHPAKACEMLEKAEDHYRSSPGSGLAQLLVMKARLSQVVAGREPASRALLAEVAPMIQVDGPPRLLGHLYRGLGNQRMAQGKAEEGVSMMRLAQRAFTEAGAEAAASTVSTSIGYFLWAAGRIDEAIEQCRIVLGELRQAAFIDETVLGFVLGNLAGMLVERGELVDAASALSEATPLLRDPWQIWVVFDHVALLLAKAGSPELAARALGFVDGAYQDHAATRQPNEARARAGLAAILDAVLDPMAAASLIRDGAAMSRDQALTMAADAAGLFSETRD